MDFVKKKYRFHLKGFILFFFKEKENVRSKGGKKRI